MRQSNLTEPEEKWILLLRLPSEGLGFRLRLMHQESPPKHLFRDQEWRLRLELKMHLLKKPSEDRGLKPRWNARELKEKPYFADQGYRSHKGLTLLAISSKNPDWSQSFNSQDFTSTEPLVKRFEDPELKPRRRDSQENTDRFHSIHDNHDKVYEYISDLIDSFVEEHIGMRTHYLFL
jgi:hypothetical protein